MIKEKEIYQKCKDYPECSRKQRRYKTDLGQFHPKARMFMINKALIPRTPECD
jgi:hypothetical protein